MTDFELSELMTEWNLVFTGTRDRAAIQGSPERCLTRAAVTDASNRTWVLECITPDNLPRKRQIAGTLDRLQQAGLKPIHPWLTNRHGDIFTGYNRQHWSLRPFIDGIALDRRTCHQDSWRTEEMADFLIRLRRCSAQTHLPGDDFFSITGYMRDRMEHWRETRPALAEKLESSFRELEQDFFPEHDRLPRSFCHGDFHPLNIVWGENSIRSVIDWEFCGVKPEAYDAALLLGCIGFDDPDHLLGEPVGRMLNRLRAADFFAEESWLQLVRLTAAIRFAWMSEWVRRKDRGAIKLEATYIALLLSQQNYIFRRWEQSRT